MTSLYNKVAIEDCSASVPAKIWVTEIKKINFFDFVNTYEYFLCGNEMEHRAGILFVCLVSFIANENSF